MDSTGSEPGKFEEDEKLLSLSTKSIVKVYDCSRILFFDVNAARNYKVQVENSLAKACKRNKTICKKTLRDPHVAQMWIASSMIANIGCPIGKAKVERFIDDVVKSRQCFLKFFNENMMCNCKNLPKQIKNPTEIRVPFGSYPAGRKLLQDRIDHLINVNDFQTAGTLIALFSQALPVPQTEAEMKARTSVDDSPFKQTAEPVTPRREVAPAPPPPPVGASSYVAASHIARRLRFNSETVDELSSRFLPSGLRSSSESDSISEKVEREVI